MSQIFKSKIPIDILFKLLDNIAIKDEKKYVVDNNSYKKGILNNSINEFLENCKPYYFLSKKKYLEKKITYNSLITVIRQICNYNEIKYTSQIEYDKSKYSILYFIYFAN
jgi:hypothetical protein